MHDLELGSALAQEGVHDMMQLDVLTLPSLLHNLRVRAQRDEYYTLVRGSPP